MELLNDFDGSDPVSHLLRSVRVRSTVYCRSRLTAPWGFGVEAHDNPAFHLVASGHGWLEVDGEREQLELDAGDLVVLVTGRRHVMRDDPASEATGLDDLLAAGRSTSGRLVHGGGGPATLLLCGGFALEAGAADSMMRALPPVLVIRGQRGGPPPWLAATIEMLNAEIESDAPGAEEVTTRLADALLTQALRAALVDLQASGETPVLALHEPRIAAAVALIQRRPDHDWTVSELAAEVALSRSAFAARFRYAVGESPMRYLTRTRLARAAELLRTTDMPLAQVATRAGYGNEFSLGKAFKREFGIAPGAYRSRSAEPPDLALVDARG